MARQLAADGVKALVSFGMAGGLDPALRPGDLVVGSSVALPDGRVIGADPTWWSAALSRVAEDAPKTAAPRPKIIAGQVYGSDAAILSAPAKADLFARTGSVAVDLESAAVARVAAAYDLPFAVIRAVADPSDRPVPSLALAGMGPGGEMRPLAVVRRLIGAPKHLPALIRLGGDTRRSLAALHTVPWYAIVEAAPIRMESDGRTRV